MSPLRFDDDEDLDVFASALAGTSDEDLVAARAQMVTDMTALLRDQERLNRSEVQRLEDPDNPGDFILEPHTPNVEIADNMANAIGFFEDELATRGLDPLGAKLPPGSSTAAQAQANVNARYAELAERRRAAKEDERLRQEALDEGISQFDDTFEFETQKQKDNLAEKQRGTNVNATLDLLEAQVRRGELTRAQAHDRMTAATESANVQARTVEAFGGKNLAPGTEFFPNLGPDSAVASAATAFGFPFQPFETGGTFGLNPAANASAITQAVAGSEGTDQVQAAIQNATGILSGLGIPGAS